MKNKFFSTLVLAVLIFNFASADEIPQCPPPIRTTWLYVDVRIEGFNNSTGKEIPSTEVCSVWIPVPFSDLRGFNNCWSDQKPIIQKCEATINGKPLTFSISGNSDLARVNRFGEEKDWKKFQLDTKVENRAGKTLVNRQSRTITTNLEEQNLYLLEFEPLTELQGPNATYFFSVDAKLYDPLHVIMYDEVAL